MTPSREISGLIKIMAALRTPDTGCPWDLQQDFASIAPYTIEEAYEVADAIERRDWQDLCDELGDLLLQPIYHARMAEEAGLFNFGDVVEAINTKMIRRHPHVFGDEKARKAGMAKGAWENIKARENEEKAERRRAAGNDTEAQPSLLSDIASTLPALQSAVKLQKRAAGVGFDWQTITGVLEKVEEELAEVTKAIAEQNKSAIEMEIGDLLFTIANLARHLEIEPDNALRKANKKFRTRFAHMENSFQEKGSSIQQAGTLEMEMAWGNAKRVE